MCLVSFTPIDTGFVICSNRDESPTRSATEIFEEHHHKQSILFPKDTQGGSWIFCDNYGTVVCILNGAFTSHKRQLPYRLSRGIMMKEYFSYKGISDFIQHFNFENIEPFTMIIADQGKLFEFRWDGISKHIQILNPKKAYNWSSCTLYTPERSQARTELFVQKISETQDINPVSLKKIHLTGDLGNSEYNFRMSYKDRVRTISFTSIKVSEAQVDFYFNNLEQETETSKILKRI